MTSGSARTVSTLLTGGGFFEGPRWRDGTWWVSDFYRHQISRVTPAGEETVVATVEAQPSGLGWLPDDALVVSSMKDHKLLRIAGGVTTELADLSELATGHLNDLVVSERGDVYVGNFGFDLMGGGDPVLAPIIRVAASGEVSVATEPLWFPNGSMITPDGRTLLVGETMGNRVSAFAIAEDGSLGPRETWAEFAPLPTATDTASAMGQLVVAPDGSTLDAEGHVWTADALGNRCVRVAPGGEIVDEIRHPEGHGIYACQLGGPDGTTLLLCCAPDFFGHERADAREAVLCTVEVDVPHAGLP